ncbi:hypothetical protein, partial [Bradyrhizobium sp. RP6]|uniref:hypothetical protein n=1 Tax=Bradyrhizobium sp. RP6 TaxID=2489596 RepID=UPI001AECFEE8
AAVRLTLTAGLTSNTGATTLGTAKVRDTTTRTFSRDSGTRIVPKAGGKDWRTGLIAPVRGTVRSVVTVRNEQTAAVRQTGKQALTGVPAIDRFVIAQPPADMRAREIALRIVAGRGLAISDRQLAEVVQRGSREADTGQQHSGAAVAGAFAEAAEEDSGAVAEAAVAVAGRTST